MRRILFALLIPSLAFSASKGDIYKKLQDGLGKMVTEYRGGSKKAKENTNALFLAVVDFENVGPDAKKLELGGGLAEMVSVQAGKLGGGIKIVDRKRMKTIMKELALSATGIVDEGSAKQTGRILAADMIVSGSVSRLGGTVSVALRMVDVETAQQASAITVELPAAQLIPMAQASSLESKYPITSAFRSLSVPGWGHFANDQPGWGAFYMVTTAAALVGAIYFTVEYENAKRVYNGIDENNFQAYYPSAITPQEAASKAYTDAETVNGLRQYLWIATGGIWALNVVHAGIAAAAINAKIKQNTYQPPALPSPFKPVAFWMLPTKDGATAQVAWQF